MNSEKPNEFVQILNSVYHSVSRYFNITKDNAQRFAKSVRSSFGRLKCNKVDVADGNANGVRIIHVQGVSYELMEFDPRQFCTDTSNARPRASDNGNVTVINVKPVNPNLNTNPSIHARMKIVPKDIIIGAPVRKYMGKANPKALPLRSKPKPIYRRKGRRIDDWDYIPRNVEHLEFDKFWWTSKDANLIL